MLLALTEQLEQGEALSAGHVATAVAALVNESVPADSKAAFLSALGQKGETVEEIAAFVRELRRLSLVLPIDAATRRREILDVCGTGGDRLNTFNISTTVALVAAAAGVTVAKHGNRAITSQSGSADVLEALGIRVDLSPEECARWLQAHRFAFVFAPRFHPAFRHLAPARRLCAERGQRTIFNYLGPLLNPARPSVQLVGVPSAGLCEPIARVLQSVGVRRGMVVSGTVAGAGAVAPAALDELSTLGTTTVAEFYHDRALSVSTLDPAVFPLQPARLADLVGGDRTTNALLVRGVIQGKDRGPRRDAVLLNAGAALFVAGVTRSVAEGWERAEQVLDDGRVAAKLQELVEASRASSGAGSG